MLSIGSRQLNNSKVRRKGDALSPSFTGLNTAKVNFHPLTDKVSHSVLNDIHKSLSTKVLQTAPDFISKNGSDFYYKKASSLLETLTYPFTKFPKDLLSAFANRFKITSLQNSKMLQQYNLQKEEEAAQRALRGLYKNGDEFASKAIENAIKNEKTNLTPQQLKTLLNNNRASSEVKDGIIQDISEKYTKLVDDNLALDKAQYHTPHERAMARIASGGTAAVMLGTDFYNKSILHGKTEQEANEELKGKRKQELIATGMEAMSQYMMLGAFSEFSNTSKWGAPILNTLLGIFFHITSRLSTGRPITKIKNPQDKLEYNIPSVKDFASSAKNGEKVSFQQKVAPNNTQKDDKNHILTSKNIALACLTSIVVGFAGRKVASTESFKKLYKDFYKAFNVDKIKEKIKSATVGEVWISRKDYKEFKSVLEKTNNSGLLAQLNKAMRKDSDATRKIFEENGKKVEKVLIGEYEKMINVPIIGPASKKELLNVPLAPFKLVKELIGYPYKIAAKIYDGVKHIKKPEEKLKNEYNILNIYRTYQRELAKNNGVVDEKFTKQFGDLMEKNKISALNKETKSSVDNAAIGQTTQLLGTFGSIYFAMTDDYNATIKQTGDEIKANKDARLRGVNKIIRIATQIVFMQINHILKIPYAASVLNAGLITAACTVGTDKFSRFLSGMPSKRMTKEQLEEYNQNKKQGVLKGYYNFLDKLTD